MIFGIYKSRFVIYVGNIIISTSSDQRLQMNSVNIVPFKSDNIKQNENYIIQVYRQHSIHIISYFRIWVKWVLQWCLSCLKYFFGYKGFEYFTSLFCRYGILDTYGIGTSKESVLREFYGCLPGKYVESLQETYCEKRDIQFRLILGVLTRRKTFKIINPKDLTFCNDYSF